MGLTERNTDSPGHPDGPLGLDVLGSVTRQYSHSVLSGHPPPPDEATELETGPVQLGVGVTPEGVDDGHLVPVTESVSVDRSGQVTDTPETGPQRRRSPH